MEINYFIVMEISYYIMDEKFDFWAFNIHVSIFNKFNKSLYNLRFIFMNEI